MQLAKLFVLKLLIILSFLLTLVVLPAISFSAPTQKSQSVPEKSAAYSDLHYWHRWRTHYMWGGQYHMVLWDAMSSHRHYYWTQR